MTIEVFSKYISYTALFFAWASFSCLVFSFIYFGIHKKKYEILLDEYRKTGIPLPGPYNFHSMMGFWGAYPMVYFFRCLTIGKKPRGCFGGKIYSGDYFTTLPPEQKRWLNIYYYVNIIFTILVLLYFAFGGIKYIIVVFLS